MPESQTPSIGLCAQLACILDVVACKPGNVHLLLPFRDMTAFDFLASGAAIAPVFEQAPFRRVGETILDCIRETRKVTATNTNLGIVLLLAPLAAAQPQVDLRGGLIRVLMRLDIADARAAYEAIRLAQPGGLGTAREQDVSGEPTVSLREAMALAAGHDLVARQYVNDFEQVFEGADMLREHVAGPELDLESAVVRVYLQLLSKYPDSLIRRKYGPVCAEDVSRKAGEIVRSAEGYSRSALARFEEWLRTGGPFPVNPGTTADLVTASLFVALRRGIIKLPLTRSASRRG